jgi:hypothetical protein
MQEKISSSTFFRSLLKKSNGTILACLNLARLTRGKGFGELKLIAKLLAKLGAFILVSLIIAIVGLAGLLGLIH